MLYRAAGDRRGAADTLSHSGIACWFLGRYPEADASMREALSLYREVGDRRGEAKVHNNLGPVHLSNGYHRDALDAYQESLLIFREIGGPQNEADPAPQHRQRPPLQGQLHRSPGGLPAGPRDIPGHRRPAG